MKSVLIACTDTDEAKNLGSIVGREYEFNVIDSANRLIYSAKDAGLIIIDQSFHDQFGINILKGVLKNPVPDK